MNKQKLRKILRKSQPDFQHYVKKIEAQAKNGFHIKRLYNRKNIPNKSQIDSNTSLLDL